MKVREAILAAAIAGLLPGLPGCSDRGPVHESDDPATVVKKAWHNFLEEDGRTCHDEVTNNSGPGSREQTLIEANGRHRMRLVIDKQGGADPGHSEYIFIGDDRYFRFHDAAWQKFPAKQYFGPIPLAMLSYVVDDSALKLARRETIEGSPTFLYENTYHPGGVSTRSTTDDIWIGADDHRIRKAQTLLSETLPLSEPILTRDTITCSYGPVPEIKAPI
jgi:hypothetical protein